MSPITWIASIQDFPELQLSGSEASYIYDSGMDYRIVGLVVYVYYNNI